MPATHRIQEFDVWRPGYGGAIVTVNVAGTTTPASLYTDAALTSAAANPQTLETYTDNAGVIYGKFNVPLYTASAYELDIDSTDQTGIVRAPLTTLVGEDASQAIVTATGGSGSTTLADVLARTIDVRNYGTLDVADSASNTATITTAIGVAAGAGGGFVAIPAGTWPITQLTVPVQVLLVGQGRNVTILQSQTGDDVITLTGNSAGLVSLTLDGVSNQAASVGVYSKANDETVMVNTEIKRFETGIYCRGGRRSQWQNFDVSSCNTGAKLHGDSDAGGGADGDAFRDNKWDGGKVDLCSVIGVDMSYEDLACTNNRLTVDFEDNLAIALQVNGGQFLSFDDCTFDNNTQNLNVQDDTDVIDGNPNHVLSLQFSSGSMTSGSAQFSGECRDIVFEHYNFSTVSFSLTLPKNPILFLDCTEDAAVTVGGDGTKLVRRRAVLNGATTGLTSSATPTKAWGLELIPGQVVFMEAIALANQRDGINNAQYHKVVKAHRPGSTLDYESQTANYTVGEVATGATSGATARITADADSGTTGTLTLRDIVGDFQDGELITDGLGGSATANGTLVGQDVVIDQADTLGTDAEDVAGWDAAWAANNAEIEFRVTGDTKIVEWTTNVKAILT